VLFFAKKEKYKQPLTLKTQRKKRKGNERGRLKGFGTLLFLPLWVVLGVSMFSLFKFIN
jgi:hypothetical protein